MATYKEIKGVTVQTLDEDPVAAGAAWASGGNLNQVKAGMGGAGIQTANLSMGGIVANAPATATANTESYDGSSWTEVNNLNTARAITNGVGLYTAALCVGNDPPYSAAVESWDGTNWTNGTNLPAPRGYGAAFGTQTAAIHTGGYTDGDGSVSGSTLYWNGSSWTETGDLNTTRAFLSSSTNGTYTAAVVFGGPSSEKKTESWNGSAWTEVNDLNTVAPVGSGGGTQTSAFLAKGYNPSGAIATTQTWDGTSWSSAADAATAAGYTSRGGGGASNTVGIVFGGSNAPGFTTPTFITSTEEFTEPPATQAKLREGMLFLSGGTSLKGFGKAAGIPAGTWASGGSLNTARTIGGGFGLTIPTAVCAGGYNPGGWHALTEEYNGSAFTEVNDMPQATDDMGSGGSLTAGIIFGGDTPPGNTPTNIALGYDGTNWTTLSSLNTARRSIGGAGVQTSALAFGGQEPGSASAKTESWDGSSWTETSDLNTARMGVQGAGHSNTAAIGAGGGLDPVINNVEQWDGSSWTEKNNLNTARSFFAAGGISTAALFYGGYVGTPSYTGKTESWNGTSMTEVNDMSTGRGSTGALPAGGAVSQIASGGNPQPTASSETFEAEATLSTVTVS